MKRRNFLKMLGLAPVVGLFGCNQKPDSLPEGFRHISSYEGQDMPGEFGVMDGVRRINHTPSGDKQTDCRDCANFDPICLCGKDGFVCLDRRIATNYCKFFQSRLDMFEPPAEIGTFTKKELDEIRESLRRYTT